jgi:hypothetical protein
MVAVAGVPPALLAKVTVHVPAVGDDDATDAVNVTLPPALEGDVAPSAATCATVPAGLFAPMVHDVIGANVGRCPACDTVIGTAAGEPPMMSCTLDGEATTGPGVGVAVGVAVGDGEGDAEAPGVGEAVALGVGEAVGVGPAAIVTVMVLVFPAALVSVRAHVPTAVPVSLNVAPGEPARVATDPVPQVVVAVAGASTAAIEIVSVAPTVRATPPPLIATGAAVTPSDFGAGGPE